MNAQAVLVRQPVKNISIMPKPELQGLPDKDDTHTLSNLKEQKDLSGISYGNQTPIKTPPPQYGMQRMIPSAYEESEELEMGMEVEQEHGKSPEETKQIVQDHLKEDPKYYSKLKACKLDHAEYVIDKPAAGIADMDQLSKDSTITQIPAGLKYDVKGAQAEERDANIYNEGNDMNDDELKNGSWVEAFKVGDHTDSEGNLRKWSPQDIDKIAQQYNAMSDANNPSRHVAPVVIGHPKDNSPAFGWVEKAKNVGGKLMLKLTELQPEFVDVLKRGMYKTRSISLYPDLNIRHIGFLGGAAPAVKGLAPFAFSEGEESMTYEFADGINDDVNAIKKENSFFKKLFDMFKVNVSEYKEGTSKDMQTNEVDTVKTIDGSNNPKGATMSEQAVVGQSGTEISAGTPAQPNVTDMSTPGGVPAPQTKEIPVTEIKDDKDEITKLRDEVTALKSALAKAEADAVALSKTVAEHQAEEALESFKEFAETLINDGRLLPRDKAQTVLNLKLRSDMDAQTASDFAEKKEGTVTNHLEEYREYLQTLPRVVEFSEIATKATAINHQEADEKEDGEECDYVEKKIKSFMASDNSSYAEAFNKLAQTEPGKVQEHLMSHMIPTSGNIK